MAGSLAGSTRSTAAASEPAATRPPRRRTSYAMLIVWPLGSRSGSEYTPTSPATRTSRPVSSFISRTIATSVVSPSSTPPPGSACIPRNGGCPRMTVTSFPSSSRTPSTASRGWPTRSLPHRHPDPSVVREADGLRIPCVGVTHDAEPRIRREDPLDAPLGLRSAVAHQEGARVRRVPDPDAAAVVDGDEVRARRGVQQRIEDRPVRDRIGAVPHPLRLPIWGGDGACIEMVARDDDGPAELLVPHHPVDDRPEPSPLTVPEPAHSRRQALPRNELLREFDPSYERRVVLEFPGHDLVGPEDVVRIPRDRDPPEGATPLAEHRADEQGDEALEIEGVRHARLERVPADVVPVLEHDRPALLEPEHRPHVDRNGLRAPSDVFLRVRGSQARGLLHGEPHRDVAPERVMRGGLVGDDIRCDAAAGDLWVDLGAVPYESDAAWGPLSLRLPREVEGLIEAAHEQIPGAELR